MEPTSVDTIITDVRVCFDEIGLHDAEFLTDEEKDVDTIIESKIGDALRFVCLHADLGYLEPTVKKGIVESDASGVVEVVLEDNFLRFCYAYLDGWRFPVTEHILYTEKEYATLKNPITTGYPDNPKAALVDKVKLTDGEASNSRVLELYSIDKNTKVSCVYGYISEITSDTNDNYNIPDKVYRGLVYYTAGLTLLTFKDAHADSLMNQAMQMIGAK